ncbi:MAG: hypothetical protein K0Q49_1809 [Haloplasmataceae bacterium]|jgi:ssDNA-specific exonuclease RecJ|nr:hypothetical protein [Haloplasmataceae bacterium]
MLKDKGIMILKTGELKSTMHYITIDNKVDIITTKSLKNIPDINKDNHVELLMGKNSYQAQANIIFDEKEIKAIFTKMLEEENTYFKTFSGELIAIEFLLN